MLRRAGLALLVAGAFAVPAPATWSVVAVNVETGEVCVAGATCIATDLNRLLTVVRVGVGGAAAQSVIDTGGVNRLRIWEDFQLGKSPEAILADLAATDPSHQQRQYGIVTLEHDPVSFTGTGAFPAKRSLSGQVGPIKYAIQGNVLAGVAVAIQARNVFVNEPGDLTQKVMAAMLRARELGGDGRCSCSVPAPTSCGVPPPDFLRSCLSAFIVSARVGDTDGVCPMAGCANGDYFLKIGRAHV